MLGIIGVLLSLAALTFLSFRRWNPIICGIIGALIAGLTNGFGLFELLNDYYIPGFISFIKPWFLVFLLGTVYAEFMSASGSVATISYKMIDVFGKKRVLLVVASVTALLIYGGISAYAVIFILWPICLIFSKETNTPKRLWVPAIYLGMLTVGVIPGSPGMSNVVASQMLGTSPTAAPVLGLVAFAVAFALGYFYLEKSLKKLNKQGLGHELSEAQMNAAAREDKNLPGFWVAILPMIILLILYMGLTKGIFAFAGIEKMTSSNAIILAMAISTVICALLNLKRVPNMKATLMKGSMACINPLIAAAVITGFVGVIAATPAFKSFVSAIVNLPGHPYFQVLIAGNLTAAITGSAMVAAQIIINAFGSAWLAMGINPEVLTRLITVCVGGSCIVPHSGGVAGILEYTGSTLKECYTRTFTVTGGVLLISSLIVIGLAMLGVV